MRVVLICEGPTEEAFRDALQRFLDDQFAIQNPGQTNRQRLGIDPKPVGGLVQWSESLVKDVDRHLRDSDVAAVILLTDLHPLYTDEADAVTKLSEHMPLSRFHVCVAQHDFEAWLLPFWNQICKRIKITKRYSWGTIESVDGTKPPSYRLKELYYNESQNRSIKSYSKVIEAKAILKDVDLMIAASACPRLKKFLNLLLQYAQLQPLK